MVGIGYRLFKFSEVRDFYCGVMYGHYYRSD